mgnify:CR=1 FL=1
MYINGQELIINKNKLNNNLLFIYKLLTLIFTFIFYYYLMIFNSVICIKYELVDYLIMLIFDEYTYEGLEFLLKTFVINFNFL